MKKFLATLVLFLLLPATTWAQTYGSGWGHVSNVYQYWKAPAAASTTGKATQFSLAAAGALASVTQTDYPRNIVYTFSGAVTTCTIVTVGKDARGTPITETLTGNNTETGNVAFAQLTSITVSVVTGGGGKTLDIGWGVKFGLANRIPASASIYKVMIDAANSAVASQTISVAYGTITFATAPNGTHFYEVLYQGE